MATKERKEIDKPEEKAVKKVEVAPVKSLSPFDEMDRLFDHFMKRNWLKPFSMDWPESMEAISSTIRAPQVDILQNDKEITVRAELPGVEKKDVDISLTEDSITIKSEKKSETKEEHGEYYRCEISQGVFSRTLPLPAEVDSENANATFKDGLLEIKIPKAREAKRRKVEVK